MFLEWWDTTKSLSNIWKHFSRLLDERIAEMREKFNYHNGFLGQTNGFLGKTKTGQKISARLAGSKSHGYIPLSFNFFEILSWKNWQLMKRLFEVFNNSINIPRKWSQRESLFNLTDSYPFQMGREFYSAKFKVGHFLKKLWSYQNSNFNVFMISWSLEGFQNMDAVDGSLAMLEKLKEKNIYGKVYQAVLGKVLVQKSWGELYFWIKCLGWFGPAGLFRGSEFLVLLKTILSRI